MSAPDSDFCYLAATEFAEYPFTGRACTMQELFLAECGEGVMQHHQHILCNLFITLLSLSFVQSHPYEGSTMQIACGSPVRWCTPDVSLTSPGVGTLSN